MTDPLIEQARQLRRHRKVLVVAAVVGIIASAVLGVSFALGAFGSLTSGATGARNPASLIFFVGPFAVAMAIGYAIYGLLHRSRSLHQDRERRAGSGTEREQPEDPPDPAG